MDAMISVDKQWCLAAGMDAYPSKPISAEKLLIGRAARRRWQISAQLIAAPE